MNSLYDKEDLRNEIADILELLNGKMVKCRLIQEEILDGIEHGKRGTEKDALLLKDIDYVKGCLLTAYSNIQGLYTEKYQIRG